MWALVGFDIDPDKRPWEEQVLPYHTVDTMIAIGGFLITDTGWSLTERSSALTLLGSELQARRPVA